MSAPCEVRYSARYSARHSGAEIDRRPETVEIDRRPETVEAPTAAPPQRGGLPSNPRTRLSLDYWGTQVTTEAPQTARAEKEPSRHAIPE